MKHIIKIIILMVVALTVLAACQSSKNIIGPGPQNEVRNDANQTTQMAFHRDRGNVLNQIQYPLLTNKNVEAGYMYVANDATNLYVTYYLENKWQLSKTYLHVAGSVEDIPSDAMGVPTPKEFQYQSNLNRCEGVFTRVIPLVDLGLHPGDNFVIASEAIVADRTGGGSVSTPFYVCVPGGADADWWYLAQGKLSEDLNRPDEEQRLKLTDFPSEAVNL